MSFPRNDHQQSIDELKHRLVCASSELQSARARAEEETRKNKETIRGLIELLKSVCGERDEARHRLQLVLTRLSSTSRDFESEILEKVGMGRPLPEKGRLLQAVVEAGPLLQSLLVGHVPKWRNPPPLHLLGLDLGRKKARTLAGDSSTVPSFPDGGIGQYQIVSGKRRMIQ